VIDQITKHFRLSEFLFSSTAVRLGIDNTPSASITATLCNVLIPSMQAVRDLLGQPIRVTSGYRSPALNAAIHGAHNSDHMTGHACDFVAPDFGTPRAIAHCLVENMAEVKFDQLIHEGAWVHISFGPRRRNEVLTAHFRPGGVSYTQGLA
jgi:uncharacterized protein YcbK (DUF882 family)